MADGTPGALLPRGAALCAHGLAPLRGSLGSLLFVAGFPSQLGTAAARTPGTRTGGERGPTAGLGGRGLRDTGFCVPFLLPEPGSRPKAPVPFSRPQEEGKGRSGKAGEGVCWSVQSRGPTLLPAHPQRVCIGPHPHLICLFNKCRSVWIRQLFLSLLRPHPCAATGRGGWQLEGRKDAGGCRVRVAFFLSLQYNVLQRPCVEGRGLASRSASAPGRRRWAPSLPPSLRGPLPPSRGSGSSPFLPTPSHPLPVPPLPSCLRPCPREGVCHPARWQGPGSQTPEEGQVGDCPQGPRTAPSRTQGALHLCLFQGSEGWGSGTASTSVSREREGRPSARHAAGSWPPLGPSPGPPWHRCCPQVLPGSVLPSALCPRPGGRSWLRGRVPRGRVPVPKPRAWGTFLFRGLQATRPAWFPFAARAKCRRESALKTHFLPSNLNAREASVPAAKRLPGWPRPRCPSTGPGGGGWLPPFPLHTEG